MLQLAVAFYLNNWQSCWCQITQRHTWIGSCSGCLTGCNNVARSSGSSRISSCRWSCIDCHCNSVSDILMFITLKLQKSYTHWKFSHMRSHSLRHHSLEIKNVSIFVHRKQYKNTSHSICRRENRSTSGNLYLTGSLWVSESAYIGRTYVNVTTRRILNKRFCMWCHIADVIIGGLSNHR